ncbi:MAG TPA: SH3 domain-containing protein [Azospirillaceae bacterium]|nr:SH3 domain-containing protein [Azospirillaceae bacterium]
MRALRTATLIAAIATGMVAGTLPATPWRGAAAAPGDVWEITGERVNLRAGPSDSAAVRSQVMRGDDLLELRREGGWVGVRVLRTGEEGWIYGDLARRTTQSRLGGTVDAGFQSLQQGFDQLAAGIGERLGYRLAREAARQADGSLRVLPTEEFMRFAGYEAHMMFALALHQMWKTQQNGRPASVSLTDTQGNPYIVVNDAGPQPLIDIRPPQTAQR